MIAIGSDNAGSALKSELVQHLTERGVGLIDCGVAADYPDIAEAVCEKVVSGECEKAILVCGTGIGISMCANKIKGIRAALCHDEYSAKFTRLHNDANALCMGGRVIGSGLACGIADVFLATDFEGGRHAARVDKMMKLEGK